MHTRGKRVVAEATIKREVLIEHMRVEPEALFYHFNVANVGAILSGANNNGAHSANGITAMFIATGQDVANVAESSAGIIYCELTPKNDLYISHDHPVADRGHLRRRHQAGHAARMPGAARLLGPRHCQQVGRDHRRSGAGRRNQPRFGHLVVGLGFQPREAMGGIGDEWLIANGQLSIVNCQRPR
jgi:hypothetical protein